MNALDVNTLKEIIDKNGFKEVIKEIGTIIAKEEENKDGPTAKDIYNDIMNM